VAALPTLEQAVAPTDRWPTADDGREVPTGLAPLSRGQLAVLSAGRDGRLWLDGEQMLSCAAPGDLVAYSEVGYAGFERRDLRFLDTRGLVSPVIARRAPGWMKHVDGVVDVDWQSPSSVVGRAILAARPVVVVYIDGGPTSPAAVLDGAYLLVARTPLHGTALALYRRADYPCSLTSRG